MITGMIGFIAPVKVHPGRTRCALAEGAYRFCSGEEKAKIYEEEVKQVD